MFSLKVKVRVFCLPCLSALQFKHETLYTSLLTRIYTWLGIGDSSWQLLKLRKFYWINMLVIWQLDHQVFKAPQSLVGCFTLHEQRWSYKRLKNCNGSLVGDFNQSDHQNQHIADFSCFTPSQTASLCPFSTPSRRADIATAGQIIYEEILKPTCILIRWALEPTAGQVILVPTPFVWYFHVFFIG